MSFKVEEPIGEIFYRMKNVSEKVKSLNPHPLYLDVRIYLFICLILSQEKWANLQIPYF